MYDVVEPVAFNYPHVSFLNTNISKKGVLKINEIFSRANHINIVTETQIHQKQNLRKLLGIPFSMKYGPNMPLR